MLSLLVLFTTVIINYFNKIEEFTTLYVSNFPQSEKYGITCSLCSSGQQPNSGSTGCVACPAGKFGTNGTCQNCPNGQEPSDDKTGCVACPAGKIGIKGICHKCPDGQEPNSGSTCRYCPSSTAGTNGICEQCQAGQEPSPDKTRCVACPAGKFGNNGTCQNCPNGQEPNSGSTTCRYCPSSTAGTNGICEQCQAGKEPSPDKTRCVACPAGKFGTNGTCQNCPVCNLSQRETGNCGSYFNTKKCHNCPCGQKINTRHDNVCVYDNQYLQFLGYGLTEDCGGIGNDITHNYHGWNVGVKSFKLPPGGIMAIYDNILFRGNCLTLTNPSQDNYSFFDLVRGGPYPQAGMAQSIRINRGC